MQKINRGAANTLSDWNRTYAVSIKIDGQNILELIQKDRDLSQPPKTSDLFRDKTELKNFFKGHLLKNIPEDKKDTACEEMMNIMHQGALQSPVSAAALRCVTQKSNGEISISDYRKNINIGGKDMPAQQRELNFSSTRDGFRVQEVLVQKSLEYTILSDDRAGEIIAPDDNSEYVFKAQGTINVDFSGSPSSPNIKLENNTISFGSKLASDLLEDRNFLQKFIDTLKNVFGYNKVENLSGNMNEPDNKQTTPLSLK